MKKKLTHFVSAILAVVFLTVAYGSGSDEKSAEGGSATDSTETVSEEAADVELVSHTAEYDQDMGAFTIFCRVKNNTDKLVSYAEIKATFFDKDGKVVGTGMGNTTNFAGNSEKTIEVIGLDVENAATYEVQIEDVMYE